jgi:hypothetical protein
MVNVVERASAVMAVVSLTTFAEIRSVEVDVAPVHLKAAMDGEIPLQAAVVIFSQEETVFRPGGGNDLGFHTVALDPVEGGGLVDLVGDAEGDEDRTRLEMVLVAEIELEIRLLQLSHEVGAGIVRVKVLQFDLGNKAEPGAEFVSGEKDKSVDVELVGHIAGVEMGLTVGTEAKAVIPGLDLWLGERGIDIRRG